MSRADDRGLSMRQLTQAFYEWSMTLDDEENEEFYGTQHDNGVSFVRQFLDWLADENG